MGYLPPEMYGLWVMGYESKFTTYQLGIRKKPWVLRGYGLQEVCLARELTVTVNCLSSNNDSVLTLVYNQGQCQGGLY